MDGFGMAEPTRHRCAHRPQSLRREAHSGLCHSDHPGAPDRPTGLAECGRRQSKAVLSPERIGTPSTATKDCTRRRGDLHPPPMRVPEGGKVWRIESASSCDQDSGCLPYLASSNLSPPLPPRSQALSCTASHSESSL